MKVWRNSEGREFPAEVFHERYIAKVGHVAISAHAMRDLGYELVEDDSSGSATQAGAQSGDDESVRVREAQRKAWEEGWLSGNAEAKRDWKHALVNPYEPPKEPEEFEVVATATHLLCSPSLCLTPGKTYLVREKGEKR